MLLSKTPITKDNFRISTMVGWSECKLPARKPDLTEGLGFNTTNYWFEGNMVVRDSTNWNAVGYNYWQVDRLVSPVKWAKVDNSKSHSPFLNGDQIKLCAAAFLSDFSWRDLSHVDQREVNKLTKGSW